MSNVKPFPNSGKIKDEAAAWVVRLHGQTCKVEGKPSAEFCQELQCWLAQSPAHKYEFQRMLSGWDAMGVLEELADILPISDLKRHRPVERKFRSWRPQFPNWGVWLSASLVAGLALLLVLPLGFSSQDLHFDTEIGQQATYALDDGSEIRLNTNSSVSVDFSAELRVVTLERGEAHFDVAKDPSRPFVVFAGDGMVMAVGTAFNVRHQTDESVNVIVSEGTVKVFSGVTVRDQEPMLLIDTDLAEGVPAALPGSSARDYFREVTLDAGQTAQYSQQRVVKEALQIEEIDGELAWTSGVLVFQGETLAQALEKISRYTDRELLIGDPRISDTSVGGRFKTDDIDALIQSLAMGLDIEVYNRADGSVLFSSK